MASVSQRLRQRRLFQWAVAYLAGAWVALQVLDLLAGSFEWPSGVGRIAAALLGVGFLGALVLAWYHGERGEQRVTGMEVGMLAGILVVAGAAVAFVGRGPGTHSRVPEPAEAPALRSGAVAEERSIAVLRFADMSPNGDQGESWSRLIGDADWERVRLCREGRMRTEKPLRLRKLALTARRSS